MTVIKRYSNRKLYDTEARQYITLDEIGDLIQQGKEIKVIDHSSGADLTAITLAQIIFEQERRIGGLLPAAILTRLIRTGGNTLNSLRDSIYAFLDPAQHVENEISYRLEVLVREGKLTKTDGDLLTKRLLDKRFRSPVKADDAALQAASQNQIEALLRQVEEIERKIEALQDKKR